MSILFYNDIFIRWFVLYMLFKTITFTIFDSRNYLTPLSEVESTRPIYLIDLEYFDFFGLRCRINTAGVNAA